MHNNKTRRSPDPLTMQIYAAFLGDRPRFDGVPQGGHSPFHVPTLREHLGRCASSAMQAMDEARTRIAATRTTKPEPPSPDRAGPMPVVLIGPAARRRRCEEPKRAA